MRIVVVAPTMAGNRWLACSLGAIHGLTPASPPRERGADEAAPVAAWVAGGGFPDGAIVHHPYRFSPGLAEAIGSVPAQAVTVVRDPYDLFLAAYRAAQAGPRGASAPSRRARRADAMTGKPIDHPDVLDFLANEFASGLIKTVEWLRSGRAFSVRYEELERDPTDALRRLVERIDPAAVDRIEPAIAACGPLVERGRAGARDRRARAAEATSAAPIALTDAHLCLFRDRHADLVRELGYPLRLPADGAGDERADDAPRPAAAADDLVPPIEGMRFRYARKGGKERFVQVGEEMIKRFVEDGGLRPDDRVLDVGSGVGRMAVALTRYLSPTARYEGFDVDAEGIAWCEANVTPRFPNFRFQMADVYNKHYHPAGSQPASSYRFPYDDASFDFVFLTSVFTHLVPDDLANYLREIGRVLAPGGRSFVTMFLLNPEAEREIARGNAIRDFPYAKGVYRVENDEFPERAVAYDEAYVRALWAETGFTVVEPIRYGGWPRRKLTGDGHQDTIVAVKRA